MHPNRFKTLSTLSSRPPVAPEQITKISENFGSHTFSLKEMQARLPKDAFERLQKVAQGDDKLDMKLAGIVAEAAKKWAIANGATHFTHWFQPMTGLTAEKHDSFVSFDDDGKVVEKFSGGQLLQSEPDASSFPSGGMRSTFEARGYTAWDVSSPLFILDYAGSKVLCVPSVFVSYTGHSLDTKTGLLRSIDSLGLAATQLLNELGDKKVTRVHTTIGCEQEYFLIDSAYVNQRPDLLMTGRTLIGGDMPKGQQLEDHYFGSIPARVRSFMTDAETELYKLGVPVKTRHNEVAPSQFETAPIFEDANQATDHNMLTMEVFRRLAEKHNFSCLLHEKPFAGINGSGKHCNWSMSTSTGENLLEPGQTPHQNFRFIAVLSCVLMAVYKYQIALRASIASHGNDHRLGANEAPPAIISVFLGSALTQICETISNAQELSKKSAEKAMIDFGLNRLPSIPKDNTDRNRTSPFAFTGNKFEFRAVGSSQHIAFPVTVLNAAVAVTMKQFIERLRAKKSGAASTESAVLEVAREFIRESQAIRFEGDGYSEEWRREARKRGLSEMLKTPESLEALADPANHQFLVDAGIYREEEFHAVCEIRTERYNKHLDIEAQTMITMVRQFVMPAAQKFAAQIGETLKAAEFIGSGAAVNQKWLLTDVLTLTEQIYGQVSRLQTEQKAALEAGSHFKTAHAFANKVAPIMDELRTLCDRLEAITSDELWALPKYREMLFIR
jgi:glutamine synthetase